MFKFEPVDQALNITNKRMVMSALSTLTSAAAEQFREVVADVYRADAVVNGSHPLNELNGVEAIRTVFWEPLRRAMPDLERRNDVVIGGRYHNPRMATTSDWVGMVGNYVGTFEGDWMGIPANRRVVTVRYSECHNIVDGKIATSYVLIDFLDLMRQVGFWPLAPSLGTEGRWLGPMSNDGIVLTPQDEARSQKTIELVLAMHAGLFQYTGEAPTRSVLDKMEQKRFWHPKMMWYGPSGIGTTRALQGFEDYHQIPFLVAFPDRHAPIAGGHYIRIGDGCYAATGGWPSLEATHTGNDWLGIPATGKAVGMRVMDFYRCDDNSIVENWVPIDIIHVLLQLGVDIFGRMRHQYRQNGAISVSEWMV